MSCPVEPSPEISHRDDFPHLCVQRQFGRVIEVGVDRAEYSQLFLSRWAEHASIFLGVDSYQPYDEMGWDRSGDKAVAAIRYERYARVAKMAIGQSCDIAKHLLSLRGVNGLYGDPFDFIYIDGSHQKSSVQADIADWWPLVSDRGILAGHDWDLKDGEHGGVKEAVVEFATVHRLTVYHTTNDYPQSWYVYKQGMPVQRCRIS